MDFKTLTEAPVCTRAELSRLRHQLRCKRGLPSYMVFTGGTTGMPQVIYGCEEDLAVRTNAAVLRQSTQMRPLKLTTDGGHHGAIPQVPGRMSYMQVPFRNRKNYEWAWHLLTTEHDFEGHEKKISYALLPLPAIKKLVYFILENDLDTSALSLVGVGSFAWHLSRPWRRLIERVLRARLIDHFGFTEIPGAIGRECQYCGWYHYGPESVWEVVDPWSGRPVEDGIGKLLVTSLMPHIQDLVLFRYEAGDLVELGPMCDNAGDRGFRPVGRMTQSIGVTDRSGAKVWALMPSQIQEQVDLHHWVGSLKDSRFSGITSTDDDSFPRWRVRGRESEGSTVIEIDVEMKSDPRLFYDEWRSFELDLRAKLMKANPVLDRLVREGLVRLRIRGLAPGGLADEDRRTPRRGALRQCSMKSRSLP